jgi:hypothetical protein
MIDGDARPENLPCFEATERRVGEFEQLIDLVGEKVADRWTEYSRELGVEKVKCAGWHLSFESTGSSSDSGKPSNRE